MERGNLSIDGTLVLAFLVIGFVLGALFVQVFGPF